MNWKDRTELLLGKEKNEAICSATVLVAGVGGVGGYAVEMLARAGVGNLIIIDDDVVKESNINRQIIATAKNVGTSKVELMKERILDINPEANVLAIKSFIEEDNVGEFIRRFKPNFVIDAIDSIAPKIALITHCLQQGIRIVSSMGAGGRVDPTALRFADISQTAYCSLARTVRSRLKANGIYKGLPVVYSIEPANKEAVIKVDDERNKCTTVGTISYLPALFGCYLASYCIKKLIEP
jgi:tRNA A37 threonylcarbamoyladenosine dehydratase